MWLAQHLGEREIGSYWHLLPKHAQAKRAIWNGIDHQTGRKFIDLFFPDRVSTNATDMFIERSCGSTWQLLGTDNYDRAVGSNPRGIVFSEWALSDPRAWDFFRPILRANKGWAIFISTFRGRNHMWQMYQNLKDNPEWFVTLKTIEDTGIITLDDIEKERNEGMSERLIQQEYFCKPAPPTSLGPFARVFESLEGIGQVRELPELSKNGAHQIAVARVGDYTALIECIVRGNNRYLYGGNVMSTSALHEVLEGHITKIASGQAVLVVDDDLLADARGLGLPVRPVVRPSSESETAGYLERAIIAPSSVVAAAVTDSLNLWVDEEGDPLAATEAVYAALNRLASLRIGALSWKKPIDYTLHDKAVICGPRSNSNYRY